MSEPRFSVIIPACNSEATLRRTLDSLRVQTDGRWHALVVDDGSTDRTFQIADSFARLDSRVRVLRQEHAGESAARNTGLARADGDWLVFLDSDDWLLPSFLERMARATQDVRDIGVFHCGWKAVDRVGHEGVVRFGPAEPQLFAHLAQSNCLVIHAAIVRRETAETAGPFDAGLTTCADWDFWQRIARTGARFHLVPEPLACYRLRPNSAGTHPQPLLRDALTVIDRGHGPDRRLMAAHPSYARGMAPVGAVSAKQAFLCWAAGLAIGRGEETEGLFGCVPSGDGQLSPDVVSDILLEAVPIPSGRLPAGWAHLWTRCEEAIDSFLARLESHVGVSGLAFQTKTLLTHAALKAIVDDQHGPFGVQRLLDPVSREWGYERGLPIDRYYIEGFLQAHATDVRGRVLEVGDSGYTTRFGGDRVHTRDVLHVTRGNERATFVGDLSDAPHIPSDVFDCVILTQTLQLIYDVKAALTTVYRILKPGGVLLATFPGLTRTSQTEWQGSWYWRLTPASSQRLFAEVFPAQQMQLAPHGNVLVACAFLYGLPLSELTQQELDHYDPDFDVIITARAVKPDAPWQPESH